MGAGERRLAELENEREDLDLRTLPPAARERYLDEWRQVESRFVSDPRDAARAAERLVLRALGEQGYPEDGTDDERLVSLVSVDHPDIADRFRHGHAMLENDDAQSTENLRKAMLDFRSVLEDVLHSSERSACLSSEDGSSRVRGVLRLDPENNAATRAASQLQPVNVVAPRIDQKNPTRARAVKTEPRHAMLSGDTTTISPAVQPSVRR